MENAATRAPRAENSKPRRAIIKSRRDNAVAALATIPRRSYAERVTITVDAALTRSGFIFHYLAL